MPDTLLSAESGLTIRAATLLSGTSGVLRTASFFSFSVVSGAGGASSS